jgi:hypothetical protein
VACPGRLIFCVLVKILQINKDICTAVQCTSCIACTATCAVLHNVHMQLAKTGLLFYPPTTSSICGHGHQPCLLRYSHKLRLLLLPDAGRSIGSSQMADHQPRTAGIGHRTQSREILHHSHSSPPCLGPLTSCPWPQTQELNVFMYGTIHSRLFFRHRCSEDEQLDEFLCRAIETLCC